MGLPSVYCLIMVETVPASTTATDRGRPETTSACMVSTTWPFAEARRQGTPFPAVGSEDTDKTVCPARKQPTGPPGSACSLGDVRADQVGSTAASGPAMSS